MKSKFPFKPNKCPSTHVGGRYIVGRYWDIGAIVCVLCGTRIEKPPPTGGYNGHPTYPSFINYPSFIKGVPDKTTEGLHWKEESKKWWQFWKRILKKNEKTK